MLLIVAFFTQQARVCPITQIACEASYAMTVRRVVYGNGFNWLVSAHKSELCLGSAPTHVLDFQVSLLFVRNAAYCICNDLLILDAGFFQRVLRIELKAVCHEFTDLILHCLGSLFNLGYFVL